MPTPGKEQGKFGIKDPNTSDAVFHIRRPPKKLYIPESIYRIPRLTSYSNAANSIFEETEYLPRYIISGAMAIGSAVDLFISVAQNIYGNREVFCSPKEIYPDYVFKNTFRSLMPTSDDYYYIMPILLQHRPEFIDSPKDRSPFEKGEIKRKLYSIWNEIVPKFDLKHLMSQSTMINQNGVLLPSGKTATSKDVAQIARDIIEKKFDTIVEDEKDRDYYSQVDLYIGHEINGTMYYVHYRPDVIKRLKEGQQTTRARVDQARNKGQIVAKRIVGDFKNSDRELFEDPTSPYGKLLDFNEYFMDIAARKFDPTQLKEKIRPDGRSIKNRRGFVITPDMPNIYSSEETETMYICLNEEGEEMFMQVPKLTESRRIEVVRKLEDFLQKAA